MATIIVDIDNTILNNDRRKQAILRQKFNKTVELDEIEKDYCLSHVLADEKERQEFWRDFFSNDFLRFDEPVRNAANVLTDLAMNHEIVYLTGRHDDKATGDSMKQGTLASLRKFGFPIKGIEIRFKDKRDTPDASFKMTEIQSLVAKRKIGICIGIGDTPEDIRLYRTCKIVPIALRTSYFEEDEKFQDNGVKALILDDWIDIKYAVQFIDSRKLDNQTEPLPLVQQLADEYKGFPSNLDNITSFLLIVNTFALGFVLSKFPTVAELSKSLISLVLSVVFLTFSTIFGVFALLPRSTTHPNVGKPIFCIQIQTKIRSKKKKKNETPQEMSARMEKMSIAEKNAEFLKFINRYDIADPNTGLIQRIFDLRSMYYTKIKWINLSVTTLLLGIISITFYIFLLVASPH